MRQKQKVLIISVSGIGNTILQSPLINTLLNQENFIIDILFGNSSMASVFGGDKRINAIFILPKSLMKKILLIFRLKRRHYALSFACFPSNRYEFNLLPFLIGAKKRIIHAYKVGKYRTLSFLSNTKISVNEHLHDVEQNLNLLKAININPSTINPKLIFWTTDEATHFAHNFFLEKGLNTNKTIGIHMGCKASESYKRWPAEKFIAIINKLNTIDGFSCLLFEGPDEQELTEFVHHHLDDKSKNLIIREHDLGKVAALIKRCGLFLNCDSGLGHVAAALEVPTLAIFGPTMHSRTAPYGPYGHYFSLDLPECNCYKYPFYSTSSKIKCPYNLKCLRDIEVQDVYLRLKELYQQIKFI